MSKKVIIRRDIWARGNNETSQLLRQEDGKMCCLGQALEQLGVPREKLMGMGTPSCLNASTVFTEPYDDNYIDAGTWNFKDTAWAYEAMMINDSSSLDDGEREIELKALCEKPEAPIKFEFVDGDSDEKAHT